MVDQLSAFGAEVTRVAREIGVEGELGGQAQVPGAAGTWKDLTDSVNTAFRNLTGQVRNIAQVTTAVANGDLSQKVTVDVSGEMLKLKNTVNTMVDQLSSFADQVTRMARDVGTEGRLGGQARVDGVSGTWKELTDSVNSMAGNLTSQVRNIAQVTTAVARGDLSQKIDVDARGEILELKNTINTMVDQLSAFADQVTRVAREVGTDGRLGGQAQVPGVAGVWRDLTQSVNGMANNLTIQVRNIAEVTTAVARGDLSKKITVDAKGEILELVTTVNTMVDQLSSFAEQVTRVAREVGTEGILGGQAHVPGVTGIWKDLSDNVNLMAKNLTTQVRNISQVSAAVANGDLTRQVTIEARGEVAQLADTINTMVKTLSSFAEQVTKVAREVGTDGILGGQAHVPGVAGTWKDLTESVNQMASNLTGQVRNIAMVTTAIAKGDLTKKIDIDARGEILELKTTINTMVDQLSSFAEEVTLVAREVGTEGQLGGQARVRDVDGTWRDLTESVNEMAGNLTRQVRAIARVATAVTRGDLNLKIDVDASGEIQELQDYINKMIANLRDTTIANKEQDWLKGNLARISALMQGRRDLEDVASLIMSELTPVVSAQHGAFFVAMPLVDGEDMSAADEDQYELRMLGSYGYSMGSMPTSFQPGEALVGTAAEEKRTILVENAPSGYLKISSGLGEAPPAQVIVLPVLFEGSVLGVIELASFTPFTQIQKDFLNQIAEMIATSVNTISVNTKTELLLAQSQELTEQLRERSAELEQRQKALQASNAELEEKAELLAQQNRDIEVKNTEIEEARQVLEERAEQLADALQERVPGEHVARAAYAAQLAADPGQAARRQRGGEPLPEAGRVRRDDPRSRFGPAPAHQRHPRPVEGRGGQDGRLPDSDRARAARGLRGGHLPAADRGEGPGPVRAGLAGAAGDSAHRRAAAAAGAAQPAVERGEVHRLRVGGAGHQAGAGRRAAEDPGAAAGDRVADRSGRRAHRVLRDRHGDRYRVQQDAGDLRGVQAGRRHHQPQVRRYGSRVVHLPGNRAVARR
jgi:HAMP domain-containing protein/GAF domain-containing protein